MPNIQTITVGSTRRIACRAIALSALTLCLLAVASSTARANVTPTGSVAYPTTTSPGAHSDVTANINFAYNGSVAYESVRRLQVDLPAGLMGNPLAIPADQRCNVDYNSGDPDYKNCPASSRIGSVSAVATHSLLSILLGPLTVNGEVYLLRNRPNAAPEVPARIGIHITPPLDFFSLLTSVGLAIDLTGEITVRANGDFGLRVRIVEDMPNQLLGPIVMNSMSMKFNRLTTAGKFFMTNPTRCDAWTTKVYARSYGSNTNADADLDPGISGNDHKTLTSSITPNCASLATFNPGVEFSTTNTKAEEPTGVTVRLTNSVGNDLTQISSHMKRVDLTLPSGFEINPVLAKDIGPVACTDAQFNRANPDAAATCAPSTRLGTVTVISPLLSVPVTGAVYIGQPGATVADRYRLFVAISGALNAKLEGRATVDPDGRIHNTFGDPVVDKSLPQLPLSSFELALNGGSRALVTNPSSCGTHTGSATVTPWTPQAPVTRNLSTTISFDGAGAPCPSGRPFDPTFGVTFSTLAAAGHPDTTFSIARPDRHQLLRKLEVSLPPGLVGAPDAAPRCATANAAAGNCPSSTVVGSVVNEVGSTPDAIALTGKIYNTVPDPGEPAKLTVVEDVVVGPFNLGKVVIPLDFTLRDDYGLDTVSGNLPTRIEGIPVRIRAISMNLNGVADQGTSSTADDKPFMFNPSTCTTKSVSSKITSDEGTVAGRSASFTNTGCGTLAFSPSIDLVNTSQVAGAPTGINATLNVPASPPQSTVKSVVVNMPPGYKLNPAVTSGMQATDACTPAQAAAFNCPAASQVGTAEVKSVLLDAPLTGGLYLEQPGNNPNHSDRYKFVALLDGAIRLPLHATAPIDETTGNIVFRFDTLPDLAFTQFKMNFQSGDKALVSNPRSCGGHVATAVMTPFSGAAAVTQNDTLNVTGNCAAPGFDPAFETSFDTLQAGAHPEMTATIKRGVNDQYLKRVAVSLPAGLMGGIAAVPTCSVAAAQGGACGAASKVGTLTVKTGAGNELLTIGGEVFLTEGQGGDIGGLALRIPAVAGPYDLGVINLLGRVQLRPADLGVDVVFDGIPHTLQGVPIAPREMQLKLEGAKNDGNGNYFLYNASSCDAKQIGATLDSHDAASVARTAAYQAVGCGGQGFEPQIDVSTTPVSGDEFGNFPTFNVKITQPAGSASLAATSIHFPTSINVNSVRLLPTCSDEQLAARACPAATDVGDVSIGTPLLPYTVGGEAYLVAGNPGNPLPRLALVIGAPVNTTFVGVNTLADRRITSVFSGLPDIPLSEIKVTLPGGKDNGILRRVPGEACGLVNASFTGHGGQSAVREADVRGFDCIGASSVCKKPKMSLKTRGLRKRRGKQGRLSFNYAIGSRCPGITAFRLTLPSGAKVVRKLIKRGITGKVGKQRLTRRNIQVTGRTINIVRIKGTTARSVRLNMKRGVVRLLPKTLCVKQRGRARRACLRKKLTFRVVTERADGDKVTARHEPRAGDRTIR